MIKFEIIKINHGKMALRRGENSSHYNVLVKSRKVTVYQYKIVLSVINVHRRVKSQNIPN